MTVVVIHSSSEGRWTGSPANESPSSSPPWKFSRVTRVWIPSSTCRAPSVLHTDRGADKASSKGSLPNSREQLLRCATLLHGKSGPAVPCPTRQMRVSTGDPVPVRVPLSLGLGSALLIHTQLLLLSINHTTSSERVPSRPSRKFASQGQDSSLGKYSLDP